MRRRGTPGGAAVDVTAVSGLAARAIQPWPTLFPCAELGDLCDVRLHGRPLRETRAIGRPCLACGWSLTRLRCVVAGFRAKRSGDAVRGRCPARGVAAGAGSSPAAPWTGVPR
jgi:hypothetical protein